MAYTPNNINVYIAAFSGAVAGMGASNRFPRDNVASDYASLVSTAGAYAQQFDTMWGANNATSLDIDNITQLTAAAWESRAPNSTKPTDFAILCGALIAMVQQSETYFAGQGIPPFTPTGVGNTFIFRPGAVGVTAPVYNSWPQLMAAANQVPGPKTIQIDTSAQGLADAVIPAGTWNLDNCTLVAANEDFCDFADGAHVTATTWRIAGGLSVFAKGTTPVWTPTVAFFLLFIEENSAVYGQAAAPFIRISAATNPFGGSVSVQGPFSFLGDGVNTAMTVDVGCQAFVRLTNISTLGANAIDGLGTVTIDYTSDTTPALVAQPIAHSTINTDSLSSQTAYTPAVPSNWSPTPTRVAGALDQLAAKVGSLFPTFGLTMYCTSYTENTVPAANVTQVIDQSTNLHLLTEAGTVGPTQTLNGIGTLTTWHFDPTANAGAGNALQSEGPAGSNNPPTEFYLGDSDFTIACIFKANGAALGNFANNATCPTLFGTVSGNSPPLGAGLICGLDPGDATKVQVSGYVTNAAAVMHSAPAEAAVANGHYVITELVGGVLSTYLDSLAATTVASGPIGDHTNRVQLGRNQASTLSEYAGEIAIMLTWNRGLTASERTQVQNAFRALSGLP